MSILHCRDTVSTPFPWPGAAVPVLGGWAMWMDGCGGDVLLVAPAALPRISGGMSCSVLQAFALQQSPAGTSLPAVQDVPDMVNVQTDTATVEWADPSLPHVPAWRQKLTHPEAAGRAVQQWITEEEAEQMPFPLLGSIRNYWSCSLSSLHIPPPVPPGLAQPWSEFSLAAGKGRTCKGEGPGLEESEHLKHLSLAWAFAKSQSLSWSLVVKRMISLFSAE